MQLIGVKKETYNTIVAQLRLTYAEKHKRRSRHTKLTLFSSSKSFCKAKWSLSTRLPNQKATDVPSV
jgi:hypothetical protein